MVLCLWCYNLFIKTAQAHSCARQGFNCTVVICRHVPQTWRSPFQKTSLCTLRLVIHWPCADHYMHHVLDSYARCLKPGRKPCARRPSRTRPPQPMVDLAVLPRHVPHASKTTRYESLHVRSTIAATRLGKHQSRCEGRASRDDNVAAHFQPPRSFLPLCAPARLQANNQIHQVAHCDCMRTWATC